MKIIADSQILIDGFSGRDIRKSILLSLAEASIIAEKNIEKDIFFTIEDIRKGFIEVKENKEKIENGTIEKDMIVDAQEILDKKILHKKLIQIAQHALYADNVVDEREKRLVEELSKTLSVDLPNWEENKNFTIMDICSTIKTLEQKKQILDIASRMIAIDGKITEQEIAFMSELYTILGFEIAKFPDFEEYLKDLSKNNLKWENLFNINNPQYN